MKVGDLIGEISTLEWGAAIQIHCLPVFYGIAVKKKMLKVHMSSMFQPWSHFKARHYCDLSDELETWGWVEHNGKDYGKEVIVDTANNLRLEVSFKIVEPNGILWPFYRLFLVFRFLDHLHLWIQGWAEPAIVG